MESGLVAIETLRLAQANGPGLDTDGLVNPVPDAVTAQGLDDASILAMIEALLNDLLASLGVTDITPDLLADIIGNALQNTPVGSFGAPAKPSAPICVGIPSGIYVTWDGLNADKTNFRTQDYDHVDVHVSTVDGFTPDATTKKAAIQATPGMGGNAVVPSQQYGVMLYVKLIAVNLSGAMSDPSDEGSAMPIQITSIDVADYSLTVQDTYSPSHVMF